MKGTIRISIDPDELISFMESNINELSYSQKKFLLKMVAASMTNKDEWFVSDEIEEFLEQIR